MFIPRSLTTKRTSVPTETAYFSNSYSLPGPSTTKKRAIELQGQTSDDTDSSSDSDESHSGSSSTSSSRASSNENSNTNQYATAVSKQATGSQVSRHVSEVQRQSELAARLELALSDLSLWRTEAFFSRVLETQDWYIPFARLYDHPRLSACFSESLTRIPDAALSNALRTYGSGAFESRMKIRTPSNAAWKGKAPSAWVGTAGGYEVRCRAWAERKEGWTEDLAEMNGEDWEAKMIYVERIPPSVRSNWLLYHFVTALARGCQIQPSNDNPQIIQDVFVPTAEPKVSEHPTETKHRLRGQAFVVFSTVAQSQEFSQRWTWDLPSEPTSGGSRGQVVDRWSPEAAMEAAKATGFRTVTKARWDELKSEYLNHQANILRRNQKSKPEAHPVTFIQSNRPTSPTPMKNTSSSLERTDAPRFIRPPPFPPGILVFVRRLHPETNKTTLKALFGRAFPNGSGDVVEYLDFQKGMDSAHVRLRTPSDASTLATYFTSQRLAQRDGLDSQGASSSRESAIEAEVVDGIREVNYWEKVPEKVKMAAVAKAGLLVGEQGKEGSRRKRQRRG